MPIFKIRLCTIRGQHSLELLPGRFNCNLLVYLAASVSDWRYAGERESVSTTWLCDGDNFYCRVFVVKLCDFSHWLPQKVALCKPVAFPGPVSKAMSAGFEIEVVGIATSHTSKERCRNSFNCRVETQENLARKVVSWEHSLQHERCLSNYIFGGFGEQPAGKIQGNSYSRFKHRRGSRSASRVFGDLTERQQMVGIYEDVCQMWAGEGPGEIKSRWCMRAASKERAEVYGTSHLFGHAQSDKFLADRITPTVKTCYFGTGRSCTVRHNLVEDRIDYSYVELYTE